MNDLQTRLFEVQRRVLEQCARGATLKDTLLPLCQCVESFLPNCCVSILLLDPISQTLHTVAAPSLPTPFCDVVNGLHVKEGAGACGTAAFRKTRVISGDILHDSLWLPFLHLVPEKLAACWSQPILDPDGECVGTFGIYYGEARGPNKDELELIDLCGDICKVVMTLNVRSDRLRKSELQFRTLVHNIPGMVFRLQRGAEGYVDDWMLELFSLDGGIVPKDLVTLQTEDRIMTKLRNFVAPEDYSHLNDIFAKTRAECAIAKAQFRINLGDKVQWMALQGKWIPESKGPLEGTTAWMDGVMWNVTDSVEAEETVRKSRLELEESERQFRQIAENIPQW